MKYSKLTKTIYGDPQSYQMTAIREKDMEDIRVWRNAQIEVLRQKTSISEESQKIYFSNAVIPTFSQKEPQQMLFSFLFQEDCIGYGGLTNIDWEAKRAEVSFLVDPKRINPLQYAKDYQQFLSLLCFIAFNELKFHRLFTETFAFRKEHQKILEDFGFKKEGILRDHVWKQHQWYDSIMHGLLTGEYNDAEE
ncbi:MAG: GNAT family N-acetyltransferase [Candidatus Protochlamydia sp.]|nr:GNAT family N-acetyltransferase [Candidatus Protochlamydia sp.]